MVRHLVHRFKDGLIQPRVPANSCSWELHVNGMASHGEMMSDGTHDLAARNGSVGGVK